MYNLRNACHTSLKLDAALTTQARSYVTHATHVTHVTCVPHVIDTAPTTQMITAGGFYLIPTYDHGHVVLAVLASVGSLVWLAAAFAAVEAEWSRFYWIYAPLALLQPSYLIYACFRVMQFETCKRSCCGASEEWSCSEVWCPPIDKLFTYEV